MIKYEISDDSLKNIKNERDVISALMKHSFESFVFSVRTAEFNYAIARDLGFNKSDAEAYFMSGLYHDVGKVGMPKFLIDFPGRYDETMREQMKKHTEGGSLLLEITNSNKMYIETAKYHHCNYDGTGYMDSLEKDNIPLHARMTRVSDSADAYLSTRSYKEGYNVNGLYEDLAKFSGTWYDPEMIKALKNVHRHTVSKSTTSPDNMTQDEYMFFLKKIYQVDETAEEKLFDLIRNA